tara:strand:+ start:475 stop:2883 length:2409 start_codon:yes stop_codon:yes gene_type:complete
MEGGALFNPGFLGGNFLWWVGEVADDSTWRENISESKIKDKDQTPGWGYRYKVRIIGLHDQEESSIKSDQLPWAQVMYPITAGGGQGGSFQTPAIRQGNFVFGFFLDDQDKQVPVIMGVLGNNSKTTLNTRTALTGGKNFTPQSHFARTQKRDPTKRTADSELRTERPPKGFPTHESADAVHLECVRDVKKDDVLKRKHALACPDPHEDSPMKSIQTIMEGLTEKIQNIQKSLQFYANAAALPVKNALKEIDRVISEAAAEISKHMKEIYAKVQNFVTDTFNKTTQPLLNIAPPTFRTDLLKKQLKGFEALVCIFNKIIKGLLDQILKALKGAFDRKGKSSGSGTGPTPQSNLDPRLAQPGGTLPISTVLGTGAGTGTGVGAGGGTGTGGGGTTPGGGGINDATNINDTPRIPLPTQPQTGTPSEFDTDFPIPPLPPGGFYSPSPICDTEELISEVLGGNLNEIMQAFDAAVTPVVFASRDFLTLDAYSGTTYAKQILGAKPQKIIRKSVSPAAVKTTLSSGELQVAMVQLLANQLGVRSFRTSTNDAREFVQNPIEGLISILSSIPDLPSGGSLKDILLAAASIESSTPLFLTPGTLSSFVDSTVDFLKTGDLTRGFSALAGVLQGVDRTTLGNIGSAFSAMKSGNITGLVKSLGPIVGIDPELSNLVTQFIEDPASAAFGIVDDLIGGLGAIGGINFDVGSALSFISSLTDFFSCDPKPECSPNDTFTLQSGGSGKPGVERPNLINIGDAAIEKAENFEEGNIEIVAQSEKKPFRGPQRLEVVPFDGGAETEEEPDGGET